ncbi:MAG: hypothetical protein HY367_01280 [Candidatus Aenigmarchaeota archaeon]|nr:hypothetical protein [Candidatus Aenigmarchaeota archaeon]
MPEYVLTLNGHRPIKERSYTAFIDDLRGMGAYISELGKCTWPLGVEEFYFTTRDPLDMEAARTMAGEHGLELGMLDKVAHSLYSL